jgi:hypothetical protein
VADPDRIRVRDVVRGQVLELGPDEPALRGSYDMIHPDGPVSLLADDRVEWRVGEEWHSSRVVRSALGRVLVGERVLLQLDSAPPRWWVCEVEAIDGDDSDA